EGPAGATMIFNKGRPFQEVSLPTNLTVDQVPFQPWAREQYLKRQANLTADDPHTRCKPSGGPRFWHTPYGIEVLDLPETKEIIFVGVGAPHSWRIVYLDGRAHPKDLKPSWYGHSIGHWEGDTLVIDTVGSTSASGSRARESLTPRRHISSSTSRVRISISSSTKRRSMILARTRRPGLEAGTCAGPRVTSPSTISVRKTTATRRA